MCENKAILYGGIVGGAVLLILIVVAAVCVLRRRGRRGSKEQQNNKDSGDKYFGQKICVLKINFIYRNSCRRAKQSLSSNASSAKVEQRIRAWRHCVGRRQAAKQRIWSAGCSTGDVRRVATQTAWH